MTPTRKAGEPPLDVRPEGAHLAVEDRRDEGRVRPIQPLGRHRDAAGQIAEEDGLQGVRLRGAGASWGRRRCVLPGLALGAGRFDDLGQPQPGVQGVVVDDHRPVGHAVHAFGQVGGLGCFVVVVGPGEADGRPGSGMTVPVHLDQAVAVGAGVDEGLHLGLELQVHRRLVAEGVGGQEDHVAHQQAELVVQAVNTAQRDSHLLPAAIAQQVGMERVGGVAGQGEGVVHRIASFRHVGSGR